MKYFISQPMNGKSNEYIKEEREAIINKILSEDKDAEFIDSFFQEVPHDANPVWFLGKSIQMLSEADIAVFAQGWEKARGCCLEHNVCVSYGIPISSIC